MKTLFLIIQRSRILPEVHTVCSTYLTIESATREFQRIAAGGAYRNFTYHLVSIEIAGEKELASIQ